MHQTKYTNDVLKSFNMLLCNLTQTSVYTVVKLTKEGGGKPVDLAPFKQMVGCLRHLWNRRPDITFKVGLISKFMNKPQQSDLIIAKRISRYVKGTCNYGLWFPNNRSCKIR